MPSTPATSGLFFDAVLYGSPNLAVEGGYEGIRSFQKRFASDGSDNMMLPEYRAMLSEIGDVYMQEVKTQFAAKHGRSGVTEASIHEEFETAVEGNPDAFRYRVAIGGNVSYVIYPIGTHEIEAGLGKLLDNPMTGPFEGRMQNYYADFPVDDAVKLTAVEWQQGGAESHSPDRSWYEDAGPKLAADALSGFKLLAARAQMIWGGTDDALNFIELSRPQANQTLFPASPWVV